MILVGDWAPGSYSVKLSLPSGLYLANLEGPILPENHTCRPVSKAGPHLFANTLPDCESSFVFSLANNHAMDFGWDGVEATLEQIVRKDFYACGAGINVTEARQPLIVEDNGIKVGVIACCEAQFGVAREVQSGVAELGAWVYQAIHDLCLRVDSVVVSVHAAIEESPWPSPYIRELYHSFIDAGAAVVHGHHAHVPQGYETYGHGVIFYGLGNFAVSPAKWRGYPNGMWSLAAEVDFAAKPLKWRVFPVEISHAPNDDTIIIGESVGLEASTYNSYIEKCNLPFVDSELFSALWQEVALRAYNHHGAGYMRFRSEPPPVVGRRARIRYGLSQIKSAALNKKPVSQAASPSQWDYMLWHVMIACESHRQMLATALGVLSGEILDLRTMETKKLVEEMITY